MARVQPRGADRAGRSGPRATGARAPDRGPRRRPVRPPKLQPGHHDRRRADSRSRAATPARRVAGGLGVGRPAERLRALLERRPGRIASAALPVLLGLPPAEAAAVARAPADIRLVGDRWVREATLVRAWAPGRWRASRRTTARHPSDRGHAARDAAPRASRAGAARRAGAGRRRPRRAASGSPTAWRVCRASRPGSRAAMRRSIASSASWRRPALSPPSLAELERQTGRRDIAAFSGWRPQTGRVEAVERDRYYARPALERFTASAGRHRPRQPIAPAAMRDRLGISRKYHDPARSSGPTPRASPSGSGTSGGSETLDTPPFGRPFFTHASSIRSRSPGGARRSTLRQMRYAHGPLGVAGVVARTAGGCRNPGGGAGERRATSHRAEGELPQSVLSRRRRFRS